MGNLGKLTESFSTLPFHEMWHWQLWCVIQHVLRARGQQGQLRCVTLMCLGHVDFKGSVCALLCIDFTSAGQAA